MQGSRTKGSVYLYPRFLTSFGMTLLLDTLSGENDLRLFSSSPAEHAALAEPLVDRIDRAIQLPLLLGRRVREQRHLLGISREIRRLHSDQPNRRERFG